MQVQASQELAHTHPHWPTLAHKDGAHMSEGCLHAFEAARRECCKCAAANPEAWECS